MAADLDSGSASDAVLSLGAGKMQHVQDTIRHADGVPHLPGGNGSEKAGAKTGVARLVLEATVVTDPGKLRENTGKLYSSSEIKTGEGGVRSESEKVPPQPANLASLEGALGLNEEAQPSLQLTEQESLAYPPVREMESGEGPPYAPPGWRWRVGRRQANGTWTDRYFYPPGGKREFASKKQVEQYLKYTQPGIDLDAFWETYRWRIPAVDGSGEKRRPDTGSDASARPTTSDTTKRAKSSRESSPAVAQAHSTSPAPSDPRSCPKRSVACGLVTGKSFLLVATKVAPCDICCAEEGFCRTCSCIFCNGDVRGDASNSVHVSGIWCARSSGAGLCGHAAHLRCALTNKAAVSNKKERTVNYLCRRCGETNILSLDDGRPVSAGDPPFLPDNQQSQSTSLASGTSKLDPTANGHHAFGNHEAHLIAGTKGELDQIVEAGENGFTSGGQRNGEAKETGTEDEYEDRVKEERHGQSSTAQLDSDRGGSAAQAGTPPLEALNSFTGRSDAGGEEQQEGRSHEGGHSHQEKQPPGMKQEPAQSEDPFEVELARALLHLPDGLPDDGAPPLTDSDEFQTEKRRKDLLIAVTDGLRERGESSDSGDEPQASTPGGGLNTLAGRRILAEEKGAYGLRKSASQQSFDSGYSTPPDEVIDGVSRPKRSRGRARTPRTSSKPSQWVRAAQDVTNGAHSDDQMAAELLGGAFDGEKQWNIPPKKRGGPGRPKRKMEPAGPVASREPSAGLSEDAAPASDDELNPKNPPKSRFVTDGFHRTAARVKKEGYFEVAVKRDEEEENPGPIPIGSKIPRASRSARHTRVHISASFLLATSEHDSPAQSDSQPHDLDTPGSPGVRSESPSVSGLKRKLEARENGPAPKRKGRPPGSRKDGGNGRGVVVDFEADLDGAMNGGFGAAKAWLHQQAGLTLLESQQLTSQEERVHSACRALKQQIDTFSPTGKTLFSRLDDLIDKLKAAKDAARQEIGEYHKMVVQLLDNRGVHVQMY